MTVGIDIRSLVSGRRSGVEEYILRLCESLFELDKAVTYKLFVSGLKSAHKSFRFDRFENVEVIHLRIPNKILNASLRFLHYPHIDKLLGGVDVLFYPNILFGSVSSEVPYVVTFHDLSFVHFHEFLNLKRKLWHWFVSPQKIAGKADAIISVSQSTKEDLISTYDISSKKVHVIHSGAVKTNTPSQSQKKSVQEKYSLPNKYILCFGTLEPRKNIEGLFEGFFSFYQTNPDYTLVVAGEDGWKMKDVFKKALTKLPKASILFTGFIDEKDKSAVYSNASVFVYPSFFEGFGFPLLEAAELAVPIITSAHSSMFEIIGNGAQLIDPCNAKELERALTQIVSSSSLRKTLVDRAHARLKYFSLEEASSKTLLLLKRTYERAEKD